MQLPALVFQVSCFGFWGFEVRGWRSQSDGFSVYGVERSFGLLVLGFRGLGLRGSNLRVCGEGEAGKPLRGLVRIFSPRS